MALRVNELLQAHLDAKNAYRALLDRQASGERLGEKENAELRKLSHLVATSERQHADERMRLDEEDARLRAMPSGRVPGARGAERTAEPADADALRGLPMLPARSAAAIARVYAGVPHLDHEESLEAFRGVLGAA